MLKAVADLLYCNAEHTRERYKDMEAAYEELARWDRERSQR